MQVNYDIFITERRQNTIIESTCIFIYQPICSLHVNNVKQQYQFTSLKSILYQNIC